MAEVPPTTTAVLPVTSFVVAPASALDPGSLVVAGAGVEQTRRVGSVADVPRALAAPSPAAVAPAPPAALAPAPAPPAALEQAPKRDSLLPVAPDRDDIAWAVVVAVVAAAISGFAVRHVTSRRTIDAARRFATRDALTGLANRHLFDETLTREVARQQRKGTPLALVLVDLDGFKNVNDTRGHASGDAVLREVAEAIARRVRGSDLPARLGGDEFAVVLPDCGPTDAWHVGESLRAEIERAVGPAVTASVGVAAAPDHADDADALLAAADGALYAAKQEGRNRTCGVAADRT